MGQVWHELMNDVRLHEQLLKIDEDLCARARALGCPDCGERLDRADYPRKPRGCANGEPVGYERRLSLCCDREGCRKRMTPPSVRFLGRRVYLGGIVVLVSAMRCGPTPKRMAKLRELFGVDRRTVTRWRRWWLESFVRTELWRAERGRLLPAVDEAMLPASLLERFSEEHRRRLVSMLRFLLPLTAGSRAWCW